MIVSKDWNVLIVEDDAAIAELMRKQVTALGLTPRVARDGQEAILVAGTNVPELILMDLVMPELDGLETSRYFKFKYSQKCVPILVVSGRNDKETHQAVAGMGCDDFLAKPYESATLTRSVEGLVAMARSEAKLAEAEYSNRHVPKRRFGKKVEPVIDDETIAGLIKAVVDSRIAVAEHLLDRDMPDLAFLHLRRVQQLDSTHAALPGLKERMG
jgi:DNA-binding response OmpR family regulator